MRFLLATLICSYSLNQSAFGGMTASGELHWKNLSFRPQSEEDTPNYYGYGGRLALGYLFWNLFECNGFISFTPANKGAARTFEGDIKVFHFGTSLGVRLVDSVYLGLDYGQLIYETPSHHTHNQVVGKWSGTGLGVTLAGYWQSDRESYWQVGIHGATIPLEYQGDSSVADRKVDTFTLGVSYFFMGVDNSRMPFSVF